MDSSSERYAVVDRPGFFANVATVYSTHRTLELARRAMRRSGYTDEHGRRRYPCCVVLTSTGKGGAVYGDMFPAVIE